MYAVVRQQRVQPVGARRDRELGIDAVRPSEMGADDDLRSVMVEQPDERLERGANARVVGDAAVVERDVEVGANEDVLPRDIGVAHRTRPSHERSYDGSVPDILETRSTRRHE